MYYIHVHRKSKTVFGEYRRVGVGVSSYSNVAAVLEIYKGRLMDSGT